MPKKGRLTHGDFPPQGKVRRFHGKLFSLSVSLLPASAQGRSAMGGKFTCVVSKKVSPKAHERNLIKRRCREAARPIIQKIPTPYALIVHAKKQAAGASFVAIREDIKNLLQSCE